MKSRDGSGCRVVPGSDLSAYHDDELEPARRQEIERHLAECARCRETLRGIRTVSAWVRVLAPRPEPAGSPAAVPRRGGPPVRRQGAQRSVSPGGRIV